MRIHINLATQPYEDAREYLARWGPVVLLLFLVAAGLVWMTVRNVRSSSDVNNQLSKMRDNMSTLDREESQAKAMLAMPQNRGTVQKSQYLNAIFARKAFSWTGVFSDMEKIMPPGLRVLSITPELDERNLLQVHIVVGGERRDRAIQLVRNMEQTPRFSKVMLRSDISNTTNGGPASSQEQDQIRFDILAQYIPSAPPANVPSTAASEKTQGDLAEAQQ